MRGIIAEQQIVAATFRWAQPGVVAAVGADSLKAAATGRDKRVPEKRKILTQSF